MYHANNTLFVQEGISAPDNIFGIRTVHAVVAQKKDLSFPDANFGKIRCSALRIWFVQSKIFPALFFEIDDAVLALDTVSLNRDQPLNDDLSGKDGFS